MHVGGTRPLISLTVSTFDIAVSHLSLTRAERESREEGGDDGRQREREAERERGSGGYWR